MWLECRGCPGRSGDLASLRDADAAREAETSQGAAETTGQEGGGSLARGAAGRRDGQMMSVQCYPGPLRARGAPVLGPGAAAV